MDVETESIELNVTAHVAKLLRLLAEATNSNLNNLADRALHIGLNTIADERNAKLALARGETP